MQLEKVEKPKLQKNDLVKIGLLLAALSFFGFLLTFAPIIKEEVKYAVLRGSLSNNDPDVKVKDKIVVSDNYFSIVIPKIGANSKVVKDVDPFNSNEYQLALSRGVAHARGSSVPGMGGNTFLFAHSSNNFYNASRYNSVFYLLNKLEEKDVYYIAYDQKIYKYAVVKKDIISPENVNFLSSDLASVTEKETSVLMTCWPPGTAIKRLIVLGVLVE